MRLSDFMRYGYVSVPIKGLFNLTSELDSSYVSPYTGVSVPIRGLFNLTYRTSYVVVKVVTLL